MPGLDRFGLVLWTVFVATGSPTLAWVSAGLLAPLAGLGMPVLLLVVTAAAGAG
jgi:uncharacterized membrane protein